MQHQIRVEGKYEVRDDDYPELVGTGRTFEVAKKSLMDQIRTTWTQRRIANVQATLDVLLDHTADGEATEDCPITKAQFLELQEMFDEFVGAQRKSGVFETATDHKETGKEVRPTRPRGG